MDRTTKKKWMGCLLGAALAASLLSGCGTSQLPNQRVYDRYAALMQERRQQQIASQSAAATAADDRQQAAAAAKPAAKPAERKPAAKPADKPAAGKPASKPATQPRKTTQPVSKPAPVPEPAPAAEPEPVVEQEPVIEPEPVVEPEPAPVEIVPPPVEIVPPPVEIVAEPEPEPEPEPVEAYEEEEDFEDIPEGVWEEPEAPQPPPPPVEMVPPAPEPEPLMSKGELSAYALRVGDGVAITLRGIPTPEKIECQVDEYGMIPLPLINDVRAEGLSAAELQKNIRQIYLDRGIYKNINVTVLIPTRYYYTQGEFKSQGKFQLVSAITLSQAIAASGYFTDFASGEVLIRRNGVIYKRVKNARKLDRTPEDDILVEPNDIIEAVRSWI